MTSSGKRASLLLPSIEGQKPITLSPLKKEQPSSMEGQTQVSLGNKEIFIYSFLECLASMERGG